jgi:CubicO group peptidase (beta-lactamase class C family)
MQGSSEGTVIARAEPGDVGLSSERLGRIRTALEREIASGLLPGAVVAITRAGRLAYFESFGFRDKGSGEPMRTDAIFSVASMTKAMVSVVIAQLMEEGRLLLSDPVSKFIPELGELKVAVSLDPDKCETRAPERIPTIQDLLRHTSGMTYRDRGSSAAHKLYPGSSIVAAVKHSKSEFIAAMANAPLLFDPGTAWEYGFSSDILGLVIEEITGQPLGEALRERLWGPLRMSDTGFTIPYDGAQRYARCLSADPLSGQRQQIHHGGYDRMQWESGGGGAVSTASDYLRFTEMLCNAGELGGVRILGPKTVELMTSDHLLPEQGRRIADTMDPSAMGYGFGLGFAVRRQSGLSSIPGSAGDFYWSGVYGTYFWVDPKEQLTCVFMAATPGLLRLRYRQLIRGLVYQAIVD